MKTRFLIVGITVGILGFFSNLSAQVTGNTALGFVPNATGSIDTVTVGSVMPYRVTGDINFHALRGQGLFDFSDFNWSVTGSAGGFQLRNNTGTSSTTPGAKDTVVSVQWINSGTYHVLTTEAPVPASGMPAISCTATANDLEVLVVNRPTVAWTSATPLGGCGVAGTSIPIQVSLTGTGQYEITYSITYTNLAGVTSTVVASTPVTVGSYQPGAQTVNLPSLAIPAGNYGTYSVTISNLSDRISRKSGVSTIAADRPATALNIYSYPAPTTQPIQHIRNL